MKTIAMAMSGGVDSAVSAALLKESGFNVIGIFMKNWSDPIDDNKYCPWIEDQLSARNVSQKLDIPFYTFNFEAEYKKKVFEYFLKEYKQGRTPNPDVMCNKEIKFDLFLNQALILKADFIATGHYANVETKKGIVKLSRGIDTNKDQSYFLWKLAPWQLEKTMFPIGRLTKPEVRDLAKKYNLPNANRKDSQGICFVGPVELSNFLSRYLPNKPGFVKNIEGEKIGEHKGIYYYTIGQRHGLNLSSLTGTTKPPLYVKKIDAINNEIIVAPHSELFYQRASASDPNWIGEAPKIGEMFDIQIRYRQKPVKAVVEKIDKNGFIIRFSSPVWAVTAGQSMVLYLGDQLIGGGTID